MKVSDIQESPPSILLWGPPGTGKTALALTLGERAEVVDLDDGLKTGSTLKDKFYDARRSVTVNQFIEKEPHKRATIFQKAKEHIYGIATQINQNKYPFDALIVDSLSALADSAVRQIMGNSGDPGATPQIQHWGLAFNEVKNVMGVIRSISTKIPVVVIGHDQEGKEEGKIELALSGKKLPGQIIRYFDEVLYMRVKAEGGGKFKYVVQTKNDSRVECRSRANLENMTDTSEGMWDLIKKMGYTPPERTKVTK